MESHRTFGDWLSAQIRSPAGAWPLILASAIGAGAGTAAFAFRWLIAQMDYLFQKELGQTFLSKGIGVAWPIPVLALGGLIIGLMAKYFSPETKGHGVPDVMYAVAFRGGRIRPRVALFRTLTAAITIGSGGSAGREGPIVQIGAAIGSAFGQFLRLPDRQVSLAVACGAAGGIAATFNAPIAGVIFALEIILARFTSRSFLLIALASIMGAVTHRAITGQESPAFAVPSGFELVSAWEIPLYALLGALGALVARIYVRAIASIEQASDRAPVPEYVKPAIGGALVGLIGIWEPDIFAVRYAVIEQALHGQLILQTLIALCALKIIATAFTVGSGGSGGVFAPSLFVGAMFGGAFGAVANRLFPGVTGDAGAYALVGMAVVFAGAAHAPFTAVIMLFEMTDSYEMILPLMAGTVIGTTVSQWISVESIYTIRLLRRGINVRAVQDIDLMDAITVGEAMRTDVETVSPKTPLTALIMKFAVSREKGFPVTDGNGKLVGIVTRSDVDDALIDRNPDQMTVEDICTKNVIVALPGQTLSAALTQFGAARVGRLPVVDPHDPNRLIGMLDRSGIVEAYARRYGKVQELIRRADEMSQLREAGQATIIQTHIKAGSALAGKTVAEAQFPAGAILVSVQRGAESIAPRGSTQLKAGDALMVWSTRAADAATRQWLQEHT